MHNVLSMDIKLKGESGASKLLFNYKFHNTAEQTITFDDIYGDNFVTKTIDVSENPDELTNIGFTNTGSDRVYLNSITLHYADYTISSGYLEYIGNTKTCSKTLA